MRRDPEWDRSDNLPEPLTSFVGREREVADLDRLLANNRLVTLVGAPGVGKTRLALRVAEEARGRFADGAWLVELAPLADPALVPRAVASVLGVRETPDQPPRAALLSALASRQLLLVLDNCEHLVQASAELAAEVLRACLRVRILATSREVLAVAGEATWAVPPLALPEPDRPPLPEHLAETEAVRLFVERAQLAASGFAVNDRNAAAVAQICRRLDGIPLALEMAAARLRVLSAEQVAARLDDRFRLLGAGSRAVLPRQQTLRALLDWSYDLLADEERALLRRLSQFAGGWTLEAAEAVAAEGAEAVAGDEGRGATPVLNGLASLVDKSLVLADRHTPDGEVRYRLLETIRQYAGERLGGDEEEAVRRRHRDWILRVARAAEAQIWGREQVAGLDRLEQEHDNVRAALRWSAEQGGAELEPALLLAGALWRFWQVRGYLREGRGWLARLLAAADDRDAEPGRPTPGRAAALNAVAFLAFMEGDYALAEARHRETLEVRRALGDREGVAETLNNLGLVLRCAGDHAAAVALFDEALAACRALGGRARETHVLNNLARAAYYRGDHVAARALHERSLALGRELGDSWAVAICLGDLGDLHQAQGNADAARRLHEESLDLWRQLGDHRGVAQCLEGFAGLDASARPGRAVRLIGAATAARELIGVVPSLARRAALDRTLEQARVSLGDDGFVAAWAEGRAMSLDRAVEYAASAPASAGAPAPALAGADAGPDGTLALTTREREVAALVGRGLTGRQVAETLVVSPRTVEWHVANLVAKLGLETRAQLALWAHEHGLAATDPAEE